MVAIVDVCTFFNELDLLEYRLEYMYPFVDRFVLVEATTSFAGKPKEMLFKLNEERYARFRDKIMYVEVDLPQTKEQLAKYDRNQSRNRCGDAWIREYAQREACKQAVMSLSLQDGDIVLSSDIDEIPNMAKVFAEFQPYATNNLQQHMFNQCIHLYKDMNWRMATACCFRIYREYHPDQLRLKLQLKHKQNTIADAGWHFSYFGSARSMNVKMTNFSHQEEEVQRYNKLEHLKECVKTHVFHKYQADDRSTHHTVLRDDLSDFKGTKPPLNAIERFSYCSDAEEEK